MKAPSVIFYTDGLAADELESFALRLEDLGYESLERMAEHQEAGAPHIVLSALNPEAKGPSPHWKLYEALAP